MFFQQALNLSVTMAAAHAEFVEIFNALPASAVALSDDNIKEFLVWLTDAPREIKGYQSAKVFARLTGVRKLSPPLLAVDLVKTALTLLWNWDATAMIDDLDVHEDLILRATRTLEEAFEGAFAPPEDVPLGRSERHDKVKPDAKEKDKDKADTFSMVEQ